MELTQIKKKDKMLQMSFPVRWQELRYGCWGFRRGGHRSKFSNPEINWGFWLWT